MEVGGGQWRNNPRMSGKHSAVRLDALVENYVDSLQQLQKIPRNLTEVSEASGVWPPCAYSVLP